MKSIPLLLVPVILAHVLMLGAGLDQAWFTATLPSGAGFTLTGGSAVLALALLALFVEVFKATFSGRGSLIDRLLSLLLFVVLLLEFLLWKAHCWCWQRWSM